MMARTYQSSKTKKTSPQTRMHAFREPILCRGIDCDIKFTPKRKDQVFCSPGCRSGYFKVARGIGVALLEKSRSDPTLKSITDELLRMQARAD